LFYYDYSLGVALCAVIAVFTLGAMNSADLPSLDYFSFAGYRTYAYGISGGAVFNLANMLLVAAISVAGLSVAFPIAIGLAMVIGVVWNYILNPQGNPILLFGGAALVVVAVVVDAFAYSEHVEEQAAKQEGTLRLIDPVTRKRIGRPSSTRGIVVSVISGILMGMFYPLVEMAKAGDPGIGPYNVSLLFAFGVLLSTILYNPFFMNFPLAGAPIQFRDYFRGTRKQHLVGLLGGVIWCAGGIANFVASSAPPRVQVGPAVSYAMGQGASMVSALWGLLVWREFRGAVTRVRVLLVAMMVLFVAGLTLISIAPLFVK
jgi:glucose uptake protein